MTPIHTPVDDLLEAQATGEAVDVDVVSQEQEKQQERSLLRLPVALTSRDITIFFILIVLSVFSASQIRATGPASLLYWLLGFCTFLFPCTYVTQWLTNRFPGRGGHYLWATRIMGTHWAFIAAFSAWLPCVFAVISTIANTLILIENVLPSQKYINATVPLLCLILVIVLATAAACIPLRLLKYVLFVITALYISIPLVVGMTGVWWLLHGHHAANVWFSPLPMLSGHLFSENATTYGLVVLALLGVDLPLFLNGEIRDSAQRRVGRRGRVRRFLLLGGGLVSLAYFIQAASIAVVLPANQTSALPATIQVVQVVFGSLAGSVVTYVLILSQIATISAYLLIASRILLLLARDRRLPLSLMALNSYGVPVRSIIAQAVMIIVMAVIALVAIPVFLANVIDPTLLSTTIYGVLQSSVSLLFIFLTIQLFVFAFCCLLKRRKKQDVENKSGRASLRQRRERWLLWLASIVGLVASLFGIWGTLAHSATPQLLSNENYALLVVAIAAASLGLAWVICEVTRAHSLLREQRILNEREKSLRSELQEAYNELEISVEQQNELISEVGRLYREQAQAAITDAITGLPNHRAIMSRIDEEVARCERAQSQCAILFLDIDHFKRVNDTWGHRAGDAILREVATRLQTTLRLSDVVGRYGGEEFALLLPETDVIGASETAERLRLTIAAEPCIWQSEDGSSNANIAITASIGVATYGMHGTTREKLVECADHAMYRAKQGGRNRVCVADLDEPSQEHHLLSTLPPQVEATTVQVLTAAASARDRGTDDHAHRMVALAEATAYEMHMPDEDIHLVRLGALLHDIGKIGVPDAILHKPGPLTAEEWDIMRLHPEIGQRILSQAGGVFIALANIVVAHHERWDGRGYPRAIAGESIPLAARILTVIDSYDAMTSRRVYRNAMSPLAARAELQRCSGSQYDPAVVAAFLRVLDTHDILGALLIPTAPESYIKA